MPGPSEDEADKCRGYLNRRILSALLSPCPAPLEPETIQRGLPAVLREVLPTGFANSPSDAQALIFKIYKTQRTLILNIRAKLLSLHASPWSVPIPIWSIDHDLRSQERHENKLQALQLHKSQHGEDPKTEHLKKRLNDPPPPFTPYTSTTIHNTPLTPPPTIPLDTLFFARYFQPFMKTAHLAGSFDFDFHNLQNTSLKNAPEDWSPTYTWDQTTAPRGDTVDIEDWYGGWWQSPSGEWKVLLYLASIGWDNDSGRFYVDCTPGLTPTSPSPSSTYGGVYHLYTYSLDDISLVALSMTDFLYVCWRAVEGVRVFDEGDDFIKGWEEGFEVDEQEWPVAVRELATVMLRKGESVWKEFLGLCEEVPKPRYVLSDDGDEFMQMFP
ncbi:hypothetical protein HDV00_005351 [Rhizophlyctis rosea]|nr:hypothetical protein HDV00_005351 [Rhizophlyctis rosea]